MYAVIKEMEKFHYPLEEIGKVSLYILEFYSDFLDLGLETYLVMNKSLSGKMIRKWCSFILHIP